jgi:parvulin-like peptidyl-prolyl isomerase
VPIRRSAPALALATLAAAAPLDAEVVNRVVLRVNDKIATLFEYEERKADTEREVLRREDLPLQQRRDLLNHLGETVFRDLYEEMLLLSRADQADVQVSEADVDAAVARMRENFGIESDEDFQAALAQNGMTPAGLREQMRRNIKMQTLLSQEVQSKIEIDEEVLRRHYRDHPEEFQVGEQLRLHELVVLDEGGLAPDERAALAARLREGLIGGRSLAELAQEHAASGSTSGLIDLGWVSKGDLAADLEAAVWGLQAGEASAPVAARGGIHLIQVVERREATLRPFAEVAEEIRGRERQRRFADEYRAYLDRLEREAFIQADPPADARNFRAAAAGPGSLASGLPVEPGAAGGEGGDGGPPESAAPDPAAPAAPEPAAPPAAEPPAEPPAEPAGRPAPAEGATGATDPS